MYTDMCRRVPAEPALRIVVSTWNVAQTAPPAEGLGEWLGAGAGADIHAVALQEVVELDSVLSYCRCCAGGGLSRQAAAWEAAVSAELGSLERVASLQLVGMVLLVYVSPSLAPHVAVEAQLAGTGPLRFGNKGAVAATLLFKGSSLTFLCCHLAAGKKGPHRRNAEFHEVMRRLRLGVLDQRREGGAISTDPALSGRQLLVWCGDLNYRLSLPNEEARSLAAAGRHAEMLQADELLASREGAHAFEGFAEASIHFAPTYKFDRGTDTLDSSKKRRAPAYCDRVLWRDEPNLACEAYMAHPQLQTSDHRPVSATLSLALLPFDPALAPELRGTTDAPLAQWLLETLGCASVATCLRPGDGGSYERLDDQSHREQGVRYPVGYDPKQLAGLARRYGDLPTPHVL
ncbi:hypothetical protein EMIHUDRAFT_432331 [Emiliania huxleyi CCMP1516]|uniref:Inositol polyphosphate-related phosphatase domain-containing protein n=2 Tax=Emiliania huxleyi TaxID=2903 RepID=A0A0D3J3Y3_EMIH1|nr:hypothetical protein EMIHUDRAFT_432331 [Emiliania huxleyi CCMP1516]EOD18218.1 hypothetical protein EMIHUDRAFT_432331 [Emiliania huxleyi CCMP1516]|eukprot:XP_005770647.1 hypothetical protein EMIHUDRAFT_432331 [Emiliania huxleyi CCMP1516]